MITLKTLPEASLQDIFNQVAKHLLTQNAKSQLSLSHSGVKSKACAYRGEESRQCAIGCLIADEEYKFAMDGTGDTSFMGLVAEGYFPTVDEEKADFLINLQYIHDAPDPEQWEERLLQLAIDYKLEWQI